MKKGLALALASFMTLIVSACVMTTSTTTLTTSTTTSSTTSSVSSTTTTTTSSPTTDTTTATTQTPTTTTTTNPPVLTIQNGGFETGDLSGWTILAGTAFQNAVTDSSAFDGVPNGKQGSYLLGKTPDELTGRLLSSPFDIAGSGFITFRLGGTYNPGLTYLSIVDAETNLEYARFGNPRFHNVSYQTDPANHRTANVVLYRADLSALLGKRVRMLVVDESTRNDGYVTLDDVKTHYSLLSDIPAISTLATDIKPTFSPRETIPYQLPNGTFENRTLDQWSVVGEQNSFLASHINANRRLSNRPNESSVGVLRSSAFKVGGIGLISFRLGATKHSDVTYLVVRKVGTNEEVFRTYSDRWIDQHEENTHLYYMDLSRHLGEDLYLEFVDNSRGDWGLLTIEAINTHYTSMPKVNDEIAWNLNIPIVANPSYAVMRSIVDPIFASIADSTERLTVQKTFYSTIDGIQNIKGNFPSVLHYKKNGMTFIYTGDIPAMWLRDSSAQVLPYLHFLTVDEDVRRMVRGLLLQQFEQIRRDPYANAFNENGSIWERKFEIDSLCYPIWLAVRYYEETGDSTIFDLFFIQTVEVILDTFLKEQNHSDQNYRISIEQDRQVGSHAFNPQTRLIWSGYRPSDDVTHYKFFIPGNMFAVVILEQLDDLLTELGKRPDLALRANQMAVEVRTAIETYGVYDHPTYGRIYVFETTGATNDKASNQEKLLMDAANIPSLLSAPWLGYLAKDDPLYLNTRNFILSPSNPYYYVGTYASGIGDPHDMVGSTNNPHPEVPVPWHMAIAMQALTSLSAAEIRLMVDYMVRTTGGTYVMHEAFNANNPSDYSRDWFTWPCSLFAEVYWVHILNQGKE